MDLKSGIKKLPERQFGSRYPLEDLNRIKQTCDAFHRLDVELIAGMDARSAQPQFRRKVRGVSTQPDQKHSWLHLLWFKLGQARGDFSAHCREVLMGTSRFEMNRHLK